jgi:outer membrane lipoprotein-sorting protein
MSRPTVGKCLYAVLLFLLVNEPTMGLSAQPTSGAQPEVTLQEILKRMSRNETARELELKHYTSTRSYHLYNRRFRKTAEMTVKLTFRYPGNKQFEVVSESGPSMVRQRVLRRMVESEAEAACDEVRRLNQITPTNYDFRLVRLDRDEGRPAYVLEAVPKTKSQYLMRGEVWVDTEDFAISRVAGRPAKNPSFWIPESRFVYRYAKFGSFWLPVSMDSEADVRVFGHTEVQIRYTDYQINLDHGDSSVAK